MSSSTNIVRAPGRVSDFGRFGAVLDSPIKVFALYALSLSILGVGLATLGTKYSNIDFASKYLWTEIIVTVLFVAVTVTMNEPGQIGFRRPQIGTSWRLWGPVVAVSLVGLSTALTWASLPDGASVDTTVWFRTFLTTMLVGFAEEWMYRGLLLVALTRLLGLRQGVLASAVAFGLLHALNILAGQGVGAVGSQVLLTTIFAFMFIGLVVATRSLWIAMVLHGLYDFFLFSHSILADAGANSSPVKVAGIFAIVVIAIAVLVSLVRSPEDSSTEIYPPAE